MVEGGWQREWLDERKEKWIHRWMHCQREWHDLLGRIQKRWEGTFPEPSTVPGIYPFLVSSTSFLCVFNPMSQMEKPNPGDQVPDSG